MPFDDQTPDTYENYALQGENASPEEVLTSLVEGERTFFASGTARVKVGSRVVQLPIHSVNMEAARSRMTKKRPNPPTRREMIRADSEEGRAAGLKENKWHTVVDEVNPGYQEAVRTYTIELGYLAMLMGLDMTIQDTTGQVVWDPNDEERQDIDASIRVLRKLGLTNWQFTGIMDAINGLTQFEEQAREKNSE